MITWTNLSGLYPAEQQNLINAFIAAYTSHEDFTSVDFGMFSSKPENKLFTEINNLISNEFIDFEENTFLYQLAAFLNQKAIHADTFAAFLNTFEEIDQPYVQELVSYLEANDLSISYLQSSDDLFSIAERLYSLTFPFTFWEEFARSLKFRIEKLKETSSEMNELEALAEYFTYDERPIVQELLEAIYAADPYASVYRLAKSKPEQVAQKIKAIPSDNTAFTLTAELLISRLRRLYAANYSNAEFKPALLQLYPTELQTGIDSFVQLLMEQENAETLRLLAEKLTVDTITNALATLTSEQAIFQSIATWLIEMVKLYAQKEGLEPVPFQPEKKLITGKLTSSNTDQVANYLIKIFNAATEVLLDQAITQPNGLFNFTYLPPYLESDNAEAEYLPLNVLFEISRLTNPNEFIDRVSVTIQPDQAYVELATDIAEIKVPATPVSAIINSEVTIVIPEVMEQFLENTTFQDIRLAGGIANLDNSAEIIANPENAEIIEKLNAHARLEAISSDFAVNEKAISLGYDSIDSITTASREEFVTNYAESNPADPNAFVNAAKLHLQAVNTNAVTRALDILTRSAEASSYRSVSTTDGNTGARIALTAGNASQKCTCDGCQTAVSPSAYLNALLDYTTSNVKKVIIGEKGVKNTWLSEQFRQPFSELASYCQEATEKYVCQIRVAIETLRRYIPNSDLTLEQKRPYLTGIYDTLLLSFGTSSAELKQIIESNDTQKLNQLTERLGFSVAFIKDKLYLTETGTGRNALTEHNLELLFGLPNTNRNPFNTGIFIAENSAGASALERWEFRGAEWKKNTDDNGYLYILIEPASIGTAHIYKSDTYPQLVASGKLTPINDGPKKYVSLTPVNGSGLYGEIIFKAVASTGYMSGPISVIPEVTVQQLTLQEEKWKQEAAIGNNPAVASINTSFIIDPDLIGPDDIRNFAEPGTIGNSVYQIWENRREWLDTFYNKIRTAIDVNGETEFTIDAKVTAAATIDPYEELASGTIHDLSARWDLTGGILDEFGLVPETTQVEFITALKKGLTQNGDEPVALAAIQEFFGFTKESFNRLNELLTKEAEGLQVTDEELDEVTHILTQTVKASIKEIWKAEETAFEDAIIANPAYGFSTFSLLDPSIFHAPIHEPIEGIWNKKAASGPFIDPELVTLKDLPDPAFGKAAIDLWQARKDAIAAKTKAILNSRGLGNDNKVKSDSMFEEAYKTDTTPPGIAYQFNATLSSFEIIFEALSLPSSANYQAAKTFVLNELGLSVEEFNLIMAIRQKTATDKDWELHATLLTAGWKRKAQYPLWITAEASHKYWQLLKQRLVKWRSSNTERNTWKEALQFISAAPLIDPDLLGDADFVHPELNGSIANDNKAYEIYANRKAEINGILSIIGNDPAAKINKYVFNLEGVSNTGITQLQELYNLRKDNVDVSARLSQLNLTPAALEYLVLHYNSTDVQVKKQLSNILVQCWKQRNHSIWRTEEALAGIALSPVFFKIPFEQTDKRNEYLDTILLPWRSSRLARQEWHNQLVGRLEQRSNLAAQLALAVETAEDQHLITLRNALIEQKVNTGNIYATLEEKANWISEKLLLDFNVNCCQKTTRLAQAIGVLQKMYFLIRNGQDTFSNTQLAVQNANFEEDWNWLGSYESWRSLMFVYLYPENLLQPSFKPVQTEKFREVVQHTRQNLRLTPQDACHLMHEYEDFMQEIFSLQLQAACRTYIEKEKDGCTVLQTLVQEVNFQFAVSSQKKAYYNAYVEENSQSYKIKDWRNIPGLEKVERLVGATPYKLETGDRFLYVFAVINKKKEAAKEKDEKKDKSVKGNLMLVAARLNLQSQTWENENIEFKLPDEDKILFDQLIIEDRLKETDTPVVSGLKNKQFSTWRKGLSFFKLRSFKDDLGNNVYDHNLFSIALEKEGAKLEEGSLVETPIRLMSKIKLLSAVQLESIGICYFFCFRVSSRESASTRLGYYLKTPSDKNPMYGQYGDITNNYPNPLEPFIELQRVYLDLITKYKINYSYHPKYILSEVEGLVEPFENIKFLGITCVSKSLSSTVLRLSYANLDSKGICNKQLTFDSTGGLVIGTSTNLHPGSLFSTNYVGPCFQHLKADNVAPKYSVYQSDNTIFINTSVPTRLVPDLSKKFQILSKLDAANQQARKAEIAAIFTNNATAEKEFAAYPQEAYYYLPMHLALELQKNKHYEEALKYFRLVFDYLLPAGNTTQDARKIYHGLEKESRPVAGRDLYHKALNWLDNPGNPHTIGALRANSYTRFTLMSIVRCLTEYADQEFTRDTVESVPRAKELYELANSLLSYEMETFEYESCETLLTQVDVLITDVRWKPEWERLKEMLRTIGLKDEIKLLLKEGFTILKPNNISVTHLSIISIFETGDTWETKIANAEQAIEDRMLAMPNIYSNVSTPVGSSSNTTAVARLGLTLQNIDMAVGEIAVRTASRFSVTVNSIWAQTGSTDYSWLTSGNLAYETQPNANARAADNGKSIAVNVYANKPVLQLRTSGILNRPFVPFLGASFCVPNNPVPYSMYLYIQLSLFKIRNCMNIAGMKRELDPYAAPTDATSGLPMIGANGRLTFPGKLVVPATQYRYAILVERTKQLVNIAQQVEAALLSALEKRDGEYYSKLKARQDIQTGKATVKLQDLRINEAQNGVTLAELQKQRSQIMETAYQSWIDAGLNEWEKLMLTSYDDAAIANIASAAFQAAYQASQADLLDFASFGLTKIVDTVAITGKLVADTLAITANKKAQVASVKASHARRVDEWTLQKNLATHDLKVGNQQIKLSQDRVKITGQEKVISELQLNHSEDTLNFLMTKFTNADLYDWMSRVLEGVYNYFLQQATAMAKLAELQLAFERQESPQGMILSDYWTAPSENLSYDPDAAKPADRKGLTGSVRLLQDVTKLDQYAFETNRRKLQLTKTLSLAQIFPAEFAVFKQTGRLPFSTLQTWFDRDFPGHYLRVIRKVRTSVIALVPPTEGIKATLQSTGISRVVVNGQPPQTVIMPRQPESVALTSPMNATGLFEMEQQPGELLFPFEGMGVEANWEFRMEPASNMMDFSTIADVLISIDYTAMESFSHAKTIKDGFKGEKIRLERSFSFKNNFADQWFDLHHAQDTANPYTVTFDLRREDFPANLKGIEFKSLSLLIDLNTGNENDKIGLDVNLKKSTGTAVTASTNSFGLISTRTGSSSSNSAYKIYGGSSGQWGTLVPDKNPFDTWTLSITQGTPLAKHFADGKVNDLIFIVEFEGEGPKFLELN